MKIKNLLIILCLGCIVLLSCTSCVNYKRLHAADKYIDELEEYIGYDKLMDTVGSGDAYWNYHYCKRTK